MSYDLVNAIEELAHAAAIDIPFENKGKVHIKHTLVQPSKRGYVVFDTTQKKKLVETFSKTAAVAAARANNDQNDNRLKKIVEIDKTLQKHYMDAIFFRHTVRRTKDQFKRDYTQIRLDIAIDKVNYLKSALEKFVYDK